MAASPNFPKLPSDWIETTGFLPDQTEKIFFRFLSRNQARHHRLLFITHGLGEQSDRFLHFPHYLHTSFDAIALIDLPGHGQSGGKRGHIENFDQFTNAVLAGFSFAQKQFPQIKNYHWLGCSMGGLITLRTMIRHPHLNLQTVTVAEPQLGIAVQVPFLKEFFGVLLEPLIGSLPLKNEIDATVLSHDASVQKEYNSSSLNHEFVSPRLYVQMKKEMSELAIYDGQFPYSLHMMVPLADQVVDWKKAFQFYSKLKMSQGKEKKLSSFPDFYHEIFNESDKGIAFNALEDWVKK